MRLVKRREDSCRPVTVVLTHRRRHVSGQPHN